MGSNVARPRFLTAVLAVFFSFILIVHVVAQSGTTAIHGQVSDKNGAAVPGAIVTLTNPQTGFTRTVTAGDDGSYSFPGIQPATYSVEATANNFKKTVDSNVKALVDLPIVLNVTLEAGNVSATVDVTSNSIDAVVNTQDATLGNNFEPRQITQLPTDLRRVTDLLTLQPGVTHEGYVAGARSDQTNVTLDGIDINDQQGGGRDSQFSTEQKTALRATTESVEEFRITTSNPNAAQGRSSGAQISMITKSGTNDLRGSLYYFYRPTALSANSFFNNLDGLPRESLARHIFGGALGGPIVKNKVFFFYTYEGQRQTTENSTCQTVPLGSLGQGMINFFGTLPGEDPDVVAPHAITLNTAQLNSIYSQAGINPAAVGALANATSKYASNSACSGDGINTGGFRWNSPSTNAENTHIAKVNWNINSKMSLFVRGNYQSDLTTGNAAFPDTPTTTDWEHPWGFVIGHDWAISPTKVNNFRYGITRQSFSLGGDSAANNISFRNVFSPVAFSRTLSRITPTTNFSDDFTWIAGKHNIQFGGNVRFIRNKRNDFGSAYDSAVTNNSFYDNSGRVVTDAFEDAGYTIDPAFESTVQNAATALIGRFSEYAGNFTFDINGNPVSVGTPSARNFATEEYDSYVQDQWKPFQSLTLTFGLRYSLDRPVYEKNGFEVVTTEPLGDFFNRRVAAAAAGTPLNDLISFEKGGPANDGPGFYKMDWNNWQPSVAGAWSPNFKNGFLARVFGSDRKSVFRGGFRMLSDHFGEQLAVNFNALSTIGFTQSAEIAANTYNVTDRLAPRFTGFNQDIRSLDGISAPVQIFSTEVDPDCLAGIAQCPQRIESSLDRTIQTPKHYSWNVSWGRQLPKGMYFEASYVGRIAHHLLASRDVNALNDLVDPQSGVDWYAAAGMLNKLRSANTPIASVAPIPYFEHIFPNLAGVFGLGGATSTQEIYGLVAHEGFDIQDWTFVQSILDDLGHVSDPKTLIPGLPNLFFHPQYAAFSSFSSVAHSSYNGATFSLRQRLGTWLSYDFNYTWSKSFDNASGLQNGSSFGSQFIINALRPEDSYAYSDFDTRHIVNANFLVELPFGKGRRFMNDSNKFAEVALGGWQLSGIFRYNSGLPISAPQDANQWATNWNVQSFGTVISSLNFKANRNTQSAFSDAQAALNSFRNAAPGETGQRNVFRLPGYSTLDMGLSKSFTMPWNEGHKLQVRWEVFNVFNLQYFNADNFTTETYALPQDSDQAAAPSNFGHIFSSIQQGLQGKRRMQFGVRYSF